MLIFVKNFYQEQEMSLIFQDSVSKKLLGYVNVFAWNLTIAK